MASNWRQAGFDVQEAVLPAAQTQDNQARASFPGMYSFRLPRDGFELIADEEKRAGRLPASYSVDQVLNLEPLKAAHAELGIKE